MKFELNEEQIKKANQWNKKHRKKCTIDAGAIDGRLKYIFIPTGLGTLIEIECLCGKSIYLTDSANW